MKKLYAIVVGLVCVAAIVVANPNPKSKSKSELVVLPADCLQCVEVGDRYETYVITEDGNVWSLYTYDYIKPDSKLKIVFDITSEPAIVDCTLDNCVR